MRHARQAVWLLRSACRKRTTNSRRPVVARPSARPFGPFPQSRSSLPPSFHSLSRRMRRALLLFLSQHGLPSHFPRMSRLSVNLSSIRFGIDRSQRTGIGFEKRQSRNSLSAAGRRAGRRCNLWPGAAQSHEAKRSILNFFATALGSAYDPAVTAALRTLSPFAGAATSAIVGRPERLDALGAAFVNAISANLP